MFSCIFSAHMIPLLSKTSVSNSKVATYYDTDALCDTR